MDHSPRPPSSSATLPHADEAETVLGFWFGPLDPAGRADADHSARWFRPDPGFDAAIRQRFHTLHEAVVRGGRDEWLGSARGALAFVLVLDQFSRNMYRGSPGAFAADRRALSAAQAAVAAGFDHQLAVAERPFLYMPYMHSEDRLVQQLSVEVFTAFAQEVPPDQRAAAAEMIKYAEQHRDIIQRFGRFPHRNAVLGRPSTPEEVAFLAEPGSSF